MPLRRIEPVEYYSNLEGSLDLPEYKMGSDYQLPPELTSSTTNVPPLAEHPFKKGTAALQNPRLSPKRNSSTSNSWSLSVTTKKYIRRSNV